MDMTIFLIYMIMIKTKDIQCAAENCKYNTNRECHANKVTINAANASCKTFECD